MCSCLSTAIPPSDIVDVDAVRSSPARVPRDDAVSDTVAAEEQNIEVFNML
jgi:hypothetical protein